MTCTSTFVEFKQMRRCTHRIAILNSRLVSADANTVVFHWNDYGKKGGDQMKVMRLVTHEVIRRFLIHVLPGGFHRISAAVEACDRCIAARAAYVVVALP